MIYVSQRDASILRNTVKQYVDTLPCPDTYRLGAEFEYDAQSNAWRLTLDAYPSVLWSEGDRQLIGDSDLFRNDVGFVVLDTLKPEWDRELFVKNLDESVRRCSEKLLDGVRELDAKYGAEITALRVQAEAVVT